MQPHTLEEIRRELAQVNRLVAEYFAQVPAEEFFAHPPQVWSPAENLGHLVKSVRPVALALRVPPRLSGLIWGNPGASRTFTELVTTYKAGLAAGAEAPAQFVPELGELGEDLQAEQAALLARWQRAAGSLETALAAWKDEDLDRANLPHPLLGNITVRELLFFTLYHNLHHINDARRLLGQAELEV